MIKILKKVSARYGWLFITAAWLYTFSFIFTNYLSSSSSTQKAAATVEKYIANQEEAFKRVVKDTATISALISEDGNPVKAQLFTDALGIFIYQLNDIGHPVLIYWNSNKMFIEQNDLSKEDGSFAVNYLNGSFELIKKTVAYKGIKYVCCGLIPVQWKYFLENEYLQTGFAASESLNSAFEISITKSANAYTVRNSSKNTLFYISAKPGISTDRPGGFSIFLRLISMLFLLIFINAVADETTKQKGLITGFIFLASTIFILRLITYYFPFPFEFSKFELFSPIIYASSNLHPSLGDLFINSILFFWTIAFVRKHFVKQNVPGLNKKSRSRFILSWLAMPVLAVITQYLAELIISLVTDSTISLDASNFFSLNIYTFTCFFIICLLMYGWFYLSSFLIVVSGKFNNALLWQLSILVASSLLLITFRIFAHDTTIALVITVWLLLYVFISSGFASSALSSFATSSSFIFRAVFLVASAVALIAYQNNAKEMQTRIRIAEKLQMQTDPAGESLLKLAITNFSDVFLQNNFYRFENEGQNKFLKDSLINENFSGYLNKYDTRIYTFNKNFQSLFNDDSAMYNTIKSIVLNTGKPTSTEGLYYYENAPDRFSYIYEKQVRNVSDSSIDGYIFAIAQPKVYRKEALAPELFKEVNDVMSEMNQGYAYGLYKNLHLVKSFNNYNFPDSINKEKLPATAYLFRDHKGYNELWYNAGSSTIIVVKNNNWFVNSITLFAYNFILFILLALIVHVGNLLIQTGFQKEKLKRLFHFNIRSRIQATIIGLSILSFTIIGAATISFFILRFNKNNKSHLVSTSEVILNEVRDMISSQLVFDESFTLNDLGIQNDLARKISELAEIHHIDINFFLPDGNLLVSSQPYIYNKQVISSQMPPQAFYSMHYGLSTELFQTEKIGNFSYLGIYVPVKDENANTIAYLNIPYLNSQSELKAEISNFLITLINLNALIFIIAGAIALSLTGRITSSFELIGNKMREVALGKTNEVIEWNTHDEIGVLVNEYNIMVKKLEESAEALAKSEREGAWREMARQVAHEIKNPLTPMKLSIQYLQKAIDDNAPNTKELAVNVSKTLVEQIDQLSKIAGDFSQFANIGNIKPEVFNLSEELKKLVNLYSTDDKLKITFYEGTILNRMINQDRIQVNRLFTNLIKNALEACGGNRFTKVEINQYEENNFIVTEIKDNGSGIDEAMQHKIFEPNFTTKTSGTGLGLAICKAIVEKANGKIWFTTKSEEGSSFFVALPLISE